MGGKKPHSVGVPRLYKATARVLKKVKEGDGLRDVLANSGHHNTDSVCTLVCNTMKNDSLLDFILEDTELLKQVYDPELAKVLVTEMLWGKKHLIGDSKPVQAVWACRTKLQKAIKKSGITVELHTVKRPCYIRVNTLKTTVEGSIKCLVDDGWEMIDTPDSYKNFLKIVDNLGEKCFIQDYHLDDVLVFPSNTEVHSHKLIKNDSLLRQEKSTCLAAHLLNPEPGSKVLDMCAAPGLMTVHLANLMENKGTIFAVEKDQNRYEKLMHKIQTSCGKHSCVTAICNDATHITAKECPGVQYILVNPTCSGTGRIKGIEGCSDGTVQKTSSRIQNLSSFQERLLIQALTEFPDVNRVVYFTNSILLEENEKVLERVLNRVSWFQVASPDLKKPWKHRGNPNYPFGSQCLVADEKRNYTQGFFVAVLERIVKATPTKNKTLKRKTEEEATDDWEVPKKKNKLKKKKAQVNTNVENKELMDSTE